jgi:hypothetical protein
MAAAHIEGTVRRIDLSSCVSESAQQYWRRNDCVFELCGRRETPGML